MIIKTKNLLTFSFSESELFNDVSMLSAYMTKNLSADAGAALDEFCITDDERDIFGQCLRQTLPNIYDIMLKMTSGVEDAFGIVDLAEDDEASNRKKGTYVEFSINNNGVYNGNVLKLVDDTLRECLKYGTLAEFYSVCIQPDLGRIAQNKYAANALQLNQRLFQLKRKMINSAI